MFPLPPFYKVKRKSLFYVHASGRFDSAQRPFGSPFLRQVPSTSLRDLSGVISPKKSAKNSLGYGRSFFCHSYRTIPSSALFAVRLSAYRVSFVFCVTVNVFYLFNLIIWFSNPKILIQTFFLFDLASGRFDFAQRPFGWVSGHLQWPTMRRNDPPPQVESLY